MTVPLPPVGSEHRSGLQVIPSLRWSSVPDPLITVPSASSWLEIRLFYVRVFPCAPDAAPPFLTLSHLRREMGASLEINGARIPAAESTAINLRRDRVDRGAAGVTYVCTDGIRINVAVDFEVCDDRGNLMLCGSLERMEAPWINGGIGLDLHQLSSSVKDDKTGWTMDCYLAASITSCDFMRSPKFQFFSSPSVEVCVAGCFAGIPLILVRTVQPSPRRRAVRLGALDSIPEDEETTSREHLKNDGLVCRTVSPTPTAADEEINGYDPDMDIIHSYYLEDWYSDEDGQLSWFNSGVRVGIGIGLGMCVGIGIGVGLLFNSYQATTRRFRRRFF